MNEIAKRNYNNLQSASSYSNNTSIKDLMKTAINDMWKSNGYVDGNDYDFYPGMKIKYKANIVVTTKEKAYNIGQSYIKVTFNKNKLGYSNVADNISSKSGYEPIPDDKKNQHCIKLVNVYQTNSRKDLVDKDANKYEYYSKELSINRVYCVFGHEFGHVWGLYDAYPTSQGAPYNGDYDIISQDEIIFNTDEKGNVDTAGEIMYTEGKASLNNIEMVLYGFAENSDWQFYNAYNPKLSKDEDSEYYHHNISNAIRKKYIVYKNSTNGLYYYFDRAAEAEDNNYSYSTIKKIKCTYSKIGNDDKFNEWKVNNNWS